MDRFLPSPIRNALSVWPATAADLAHLVRCHCQVSPPWGHCPYTPPLCIQPWKGISVTTHGEPLKDQWLCPESLVVQQQQKCFEFLLTGSQSLLHDYLLIQSLLHHYGVLDICLYFRHYLIEFVLYIVLILAPLFHDCFFVFSLFFLSTVFCCISNSNVFLIHSLTQHYN